MRPVRLNGNYKIRDGERERVPLTFALPRNFDRVGVGLACRLHAARALLRWRWHADCSVLGATIRHAARCLRACGTMAQLAARREGFIFGQASEKTDNRHEIVSGPHASKLQMQVSCIWPMPRSTWTWTRTSVFSTRCSWHGLCYIAHTIPFFLSKACTNGTVSTIPFLRFPRCMEHLAYENFRFSHGIYLTAGR